jgi:hypothetical protein
MTDKLITEKRELLISLDFSSEYLQYLEKYENDIVGYEGQELDSFLPSLQIEPEVSSGELFVYGNIQKDATNLSFQKMV